MCANLIGPSSDFKPCNFYFSEKSNRWKYRQRNTKRQPCGIGYQLHTPLQEQDTSRYTRELVIAVPKAEEVQFLKGVLFIFTK